VRGGRGAGDAADWSSDATRTTLSDEGRRKKPLGHDATPRSRLGHPYQVQGLRSLLEKVTLQDAKKNPQIGEFENKQISRTPTA